MALEIRRFAPGEQGTDVATAPGRRRAGGRVRTAALDLPETPSAKRVERRDALYRRSLAVTDVLSATIATLIAVGVLGDDSVRPVALAALPAVVLVSKVLGLYDRDEHLLRKTTLDEAPGVLQVATLVAFVLWLGEGPLVDGSLGRQQVVALAVLLFASMLAARAVARMAVTFFTKPERCVVIGDAASAAHIAHKVASGHAVHASVLGHVVLERQAAGGGPVPVPMLGTIDTLGFVLVEHRVDRAIIAPDYAHPDDILDAIRFVRSLGVKVSILPRLFEVVGSSVAFDDVDGTMLLGVRAHGLSRSSRLLKHAFDKVGAVVGIVLLAPVLAAIALAIKLDSRGPVLFRQQRIGRGGRSFRIFKFRTMYVGADALKEELRHRNEAAAGLFKIADDPRITRVGRLLRRTSLDELPQLLNVLGGEMSLVGPRPLVPDEDRRVEGWQRRRLQLAPGMTGLWQIFGSSRIPLAEMVKIDYLYGANWSLWLDVKILLRTVPHALGRRGL